MPISFSWVINSMDQYPQSHGLSDVVFNVHWKRQATEVIGAETYTSEVGNCYSMSDPDPGNFTPYHQLTFEQVCGWLESGLDVVNIDSYLSRQIEEKKNPIKISLPLPW